MKNIQKATLIHLLKLFFILIIVLSISLTALASITLDKDILKDQDTFTKAHEKGILYTLLVAFLRGILASLTPCVFPMIFIRIIPRKTSLTL